MEIACGKSQEVPDRDRVWRQLIDSRNHLAWDYDNNRYVPGPVAMAFDPEMSTRWAEHLEMHGLGPADVLNRDGRYTLVGEWSVRAVREMDFPVAHTPDGSEPIACAHTSVYWPPGAIKSGSKRPDSPTRDSLRNKLVKKMSFAYGEITTPPPEDVKR
jgi:hypothetical protein